MAGKINSHKATVHPVPGVNVCAESSYTNLHLINVDSVASIFAPGEMTNSTPRIIARSNVTESETRIAVSMPAIIAESTGRWRGELWH